MSCAKVRENRGGCKKSVTNLNKKHLLELISKLMSSRNSGWWTCGRVEKLRFFCDYSPSLGLAVILKLCQIGLCVVHSPLKVIRWTDEPSIDGLLATTSNSAMKTFIFFFVYWQFCFSLKSNVRPTSIITQNLHVHYGIWTNCYSVDVVTALLLGYAS